MSLFGALQLANNALQAAQIGLQVTGNNIANANTPGYVREEVALAPATTQKIGDLVLGLGVEVRGVVRNLDKLLAERLRGATSEVAEGEAREDAYLQLEALIGELTDTDLSTALDDFFNTIHDVLNQPESVSARNLAMLRGGVLAQHIRQLDERVREMRRDIDARVAQSVDEINTLLEEIARLNVRIVSLEGGVLGASDAVGLRDQREAALAKLAELVDVRAVEQETGAVTVFVGGDYLVFEGQTRLLTTAVTPDRGLGTTEIRIADTDAPLEIGSGETRGLIAARDEILGGFLDGLDEFARALIFEFNKIHSGGQGLRGYETLTSEFAAVDPAAPLDQAGLPFTPEHGSFQIQVYDPETGLTETADIFVKLDGLDDDTTLEDLAAQLDAVDGVSAAVTAQGRLELASETPQRQLALAGDTSGVLAALGLNTFFSGVGASDIDVAEPIREDPGKFAASRGGVGADTENAVALAGFLDAPLDAYDGQSLATLYERFTAETTQASATTSAVADGLRAFQKTLEGQHLGVAGVSIDEEAVKMIMFQRAFQAAARYVASVSELLDTLVSL